MLKVEVEAMKVLCELCGSTPATVLCGSDQASLCWECDAQVHGANFLVAKHCRAVLCHLCQSPTPWKVSGSELPPSLSLCISCSSHTLTRLPLRSSFPNFQQSVAHNDHELSATAYDIDDQEDGSDGEQVYMSCSDEDDDDENQVVPGTPNARIMSEAEDDDDDDDYQISFISPAALTLKRKRI
ncbi:hypothetical protein Cgig2_003791 [Carnegiea gigantea]|uniref:B box-type domain-containing protein n=1 Tax=Carnegiea gigantea TaxID=171969 RepID=A0A9Q1JPC4_9CARY|nr:hypothetical protein Cgig2_003791 [Carnegiea gigantea]